MIAAAQECGRLLGIAYYRRCFPKLQRAKIAAEARDYRTCEVLSREVLTDDSNSLMALDLLGFALYFLGQAQEAEQICQRTLQIDPEHAYAFKGLGLCLAKRGDLEGAVQSIERAIQIKPSWFDPYWDLGVTLAAAGRCAEAIEVVKRGRVAIPQRASEWDKLERHARTTGARAR